MKSGKPGSSLFVRYLLYTHSVSAVKRDIPWSAEELPSSSNCQVTESNGASFQTILTKPTIRFNIRIISSENQLKTWCDLKSTRLTG